MNIKVNSIFSQQNPSGHSWQPDFYTEVYTFCHDDNTEMFTRESERLKMPL